MSQMMIRRKWRDETCANPARLGADAGTAKPALPLLSGQSTSTRIEVLKVHIKKAHDTPDLERLFKSVKPAAAFNPALAPCRKEDRCSRC